MKKAKKARAARAARALPPLAGGFNPCLHCPPILPTLDLRKRIAVGFGFAALTCEGETFWMEEQDEWADCMSAAYAEAMAEDWPECDWRIVLHGPMHGETYQRQGNGTWVLVEKNRGFA